MYRALRFVVSFLLLCGPAAWAQSVNPSKPSLHEAPASFRENWTTPMLERSEFPGGLRPELADKGEIKDGGFIRERYQVASRPSDPFDLYVIRPTGVAKPPVILYLYSYPDDTESFKDNHWCEMATSGGYAAVGFVSAVTGHRTRFRLPKVWFVSEMQEALATTAHDVQLILDYLAARHDLDAERVAMFGVGSGGSIAILASAVDPRIRAVDLLSPWGDWPGWLAHSKIVTDNDRAGFLKPEFLAKVAPLDPVLWLPKMKAKVVRLQDVRNNTSIPDGSQEKLEAAAPPSAVVHEYANGRAFLKAQPPSFTLQWVKDQLKPDTKLDVPVEKSERIHVYPAIQAPAQDWPNVGNLGVDKPQLRRRQKINRKKRKTTEPTGLRYDRGPLSCL